MIFEHSSFRSYLKAELAARTGRNAAYSLRAFGRDLGMDAAQLSGIFKGKKSLSMQKALEVAEKLDLDEKSTDYLCLLVQFENAKTPQLREQFFRRMSEMNGKRATADLSLELFRAISDWYHLPIVEMTELDGFEFNAVNVAKRLGISRFEAEDAIDRLERLEMIYRDEHGRVRKAYEHNHFQTPGVNTALRRYHKQMLAKAQSALEEQEPSERYVGSDTYSIDVTQLDEARKLITEFREKLMRLFDGGKKRTETYHMIVELFRLTKSETKRRRGK